MGKAQKKENEMFKKAILRIDSELKKIDRSKNHSIDFDGKRNNKDLETSISTQYGTFNDKSKKDKNSTI